MKKGLYTLVFVASVIGAAEFVNPASFSGTTAEKSAVIAYIKENVKKSYSAINMDDPATLRMMERKNLDAFKRLVKDRSANPSLLQRVIKDYCNINMCDYLTINRMYHKQLDASKKSLQW